jgi:GNAT superfamily N-acetyltransferase
MATVIRPATERDIEAIVAIWHAGWHDGHGSIVPAAYRRQRSRESFAARAPALIPHATVANTEDGFALTDTACGFFSVRENIVTNLFVAASHRGTDVAALLIKEAERQIAQAGNVFARLDCRQGNDRARRFYEKMGWHVAEKVLQQDEIDGVPVKLPFWIMEKPLTRP